MKKYLKFLKLNLIKSNNIGKSFWITDVMAALIAYEDGSKNIAMKTMKKYKSKIET